MKILFWCEPVHHHDNPTWFKYTADCLGESLAAPLINSDPNGEYFIVLNEALSHVVPRTPWKHIIFSQEELLLPFDGVALSELNKRYQDSYSDKEQQYYNNLFGEKLANISFDIVISWTPIPHLRKAYPDKTYLFYSYTPTPFGPMPTFDIGSHAGHFLNKYADAISKNHHDSAMRDSDLLLTFKSRLKLSFIETSPFKDSLAVFKGKYQKLILLPLSVSRTPMFDSYVKYGTQLEFLEDVMKNMPSDFGVVVTFHHLSDTHISKETISYLEEKYPNIFISEDFFDFAATSMFLLNEVDAVINCSSTVGFWGALIWDKKIISVAPRYNHWLADQIGLSNIKFIFQTPDQTEKRNVILHWIMTNQFIPLEILKSDSFAFNYILDMVYKLNIGAEDSIYSLRDHASSKRLLIDAIEKIEPVVPSRAGILPPYKYEQLLQKKDAIIVKKDITITEKDRVIVEQNKLLFEKNKKTVLKRIMNRLGF